MANIDELRTLAQQIKNETNVGANTAERVGTTFEKTVTELENINGKVADISGLSAGLSLLSGVVSRSGVPISSASLEDGIASNDAADKKHHSIRFGRVTDDAITAVGYGITGSIMGTYLNVSWSTALHRFVAYDGISGLYYSEWSGPNIPSSSDYTLVSSSRPEEQSTPHYDKVYIDNAGGVYAYSPSKRSLVTADIDLSYLTGVSGIVMSSGGTLAMGLGSITKVDSLVMSGAGSGSISNVKHLTMYAGGELNMSGGTISGASRIDMSSGTISGVSRIDMSGGTLDIGSGTIIVSGTGVAQLEHINYVKDITFNYGGTLTSGNGAVATGTGAVWANNFGVSGDLLFSGRSSVQKRFGSGALPLVTFEQTMDTGSRVYTDIMSLGKDKALSVIDHFTDDNPLQPYGTPEVRVSGILNVSGMIYAGNTYNTISGSSGGINIITSGTTNANVAINGVKIAQNGIISEVATLSFKSGGTLAPSIIGVQDIFGKNNVHISMSGSTTGDGIDFGNAPLKNVNSITMAYSGTLNMNNGQIDAHNINIGSGTLNVSGGIINASNASFNVSGASLFGTIYASGAIINNISLSGVAINNGIFSGSTQMRSVLISGSIDASYQTLTIRSITGVSGNINMAGGEIYNARSISTVNISGADGAVNIGFSGYTGNGKLDMISGVLETSGVILKSGGTLTFGDGTTMNTAATPTNLDDADNVIGGKELKLYYSGMTGTICTTGAMGVLKIKGSSGILLDPAGGYIDCNNRNISGCNAITASYIYANQFSGTLQGTIQRTTFKSGNNFTSEFIDELKVALGIS